jgi:hypothetical protein
MGKRDTLILIPLLLLPVLCLLTAAINPAVTRVFAQTPTGAASMSSQSQSTPAAQTADGQAADGQKITGEWQGMLSRLRLIVKIELAADGTFTGKLTSVDQGNVTIPIDTVSFTADKNLRLELKSIGAGYEAKPNSDGSELVGTWQQGGNSLPLSFHRPGTTAKTTLKPRTVGSVPLQPCRTADGNTEGLCGKYEVFENRKIKSDAKLR